MTNNEKAKVYDKALENQEIHLALHNCGYRFLGKKQNIYIFMVSQSDVDYQF